MNMLIDEVSDGAVITAIRSQFSFDREANRMADRVASGEVDVKTGLWWLYLKSKEKERAKGDAPWSRSGRRF